jgi:nucleobase:cation symporter-1, NCS1 family
MGAISEGLERSHWGIDPVPPERRTLRALDFAVLWGDLGVGVLVLVSGGLLVPGLGFSTAFVAIVLGSIIGVTLLSLAAAAGGEQGLASMVLFRPVLGVRGSWIPSVLNWLQLVGWTAVELWAMSYVADLIVQETFGLSARPLWLILAALVSTGLALWGPVGVTRIWLERFGAWIVGGICLAVTILVFTSGTFGDAITAAGDGSLTFGPALDLVIAMPVSWLPLVADYTRFSTRPRDAFTGTFWGYLIANVWLYSLGALIVLVSEGQPSPEGMAAGILALAGGSIAGIIFLVGLLVGETDEAFADIYSGAVSLKNILPKVPQPVFVIAIAVLATVLAGWLNMVRYESFLFLIGSIFVPLFGVLIADYYFRARRRIESTQLFSRGGRYWYSGGVRIRALIPWALGFAAYHWVYPTGPSWWVDAVTSVTGSALVDNFGWLSASIPAFAVSFLLALTVLEEHPGSEISSPPTESGTRRVNP